MGLITDPFPELAKVDAAHLGSVRVLNLALSGITGGMNVSRKSLPHSNGRSVSCLAVLGILGVVGER